jgi:hypothetical protein
LKFGIRGFSGMVNSNITLVLKSAQRMVYKPVQKCPKIDILSELDENRESGVFEYGEFKYEIHFVICARAGLQTGSKNF